MENKVLHNKEQVEREQAKKEICQGSAAAMNRRHIDSKESHKIDKFVAVDVRPALINEPRNRDNP